MDYDLLEVILERKKMQRLHLTGWYKEWSVGLRTRNGRGYHPRQDFAPLKGLMCHQGALDDTVLQDILQRSCMTLEVLVLVDGFVDGFLCQQTIEFAPMKTLLETSGQGQLKKSPFSDLRADQLNVGLTHLDLQVRLALSSLKVLSNILPRLNLIHFGCGPFTTELLKHCNYATLRSLSISGVDDADLSPVLDAMEDLQEECQIQSLRVGLKSDSAQAKNLCRIVSILPLRQLYLSHISSSTLATIFESISMSTLEIVSICDSQYTRSVDYAIKNRLGSTNAPVVELDAATWEKYQGSPATNRTRSPAYLRRGQEIEDTDHFLKFLQTTLPTYSY